MLGCDGLVLLSTHALLLLLCLCVNTATRTIADLKCVRPGRHLRSVVFPCVGGSGRGQGTQRDFHSERFFFSLFLFKFYYSELTKLEKAARKCSTWPGDFLFGEKHARREKTSAGENSDASRVVAARVVCSSSAQSAAILDRVAVRSAPVLCAVTGRSTNSTGSPFSALPARPRKKSNKMEKIGKKTYFFLLTW